MSKKPVPAHIYRQHTQDEMHLALQRVQDVTPHMHLRDDDDLPSDVLADMMREIIELRAAVVSVSGLMHTWLADHARR